MSYEAWLRTWNLDERDDDDAFDFDDFGEDDDTLYASGRRSFDDDGFDGRYYFDGKASGDDLSRLRRKAIEKEDEKTLRCAICLACFVEKKKTTLKKDDDEEEEEGAHYAVEMPCKHIYHEACIRRWLRRSRRCPTCRKSLREKKVQKAKNGSEERLLIGPGERGNDDVSARQIQRNDEELDRERAAMRQSQGQQEIEELARERRAREEEEEKKAMRRSRMGMVLEHEGMNEEIFERVMEHAIGLLEEATIQREEEEDVEDAEEDAEEKEKERTQRIRVANRSGTASLLVGTRGFNYGSNTL